jgi:polar amino acid transport system ATP-binding protein
MAILTVRNLVKDFEGRRVLDGVDLDLEEGQVKVVMGPSGCGKSTLLRCLNRLIEPTSGQIFFDGEDILRPGTDVCALRQRIGFVFQNFALYRHLTALENIKLGLRKLRHLSEAQATERAREELRRMELDTHGDQYPAQLSGGQKQRVAIARALAMDPKVLFFDEPTSALDPRMSREVITLINRLFLDNVTMLCVTHDVTVARYISDRVLFLDHGRVRAEGDADHLLDQHQDPHISAFFGRGARGV